LLKNPIELKKIRLGGNRMKIIGIMLLVAGAVGVASAGMTHSAPEIDATSAVAAVALLSGSLLILKSRRKK
jgi:hypothetical protein